TLSFGSCASKTGGENADKSSPATSVQSIEWEAAVSRSADCCGPGVCGDSNGAAAAHTSLGNPACAGCGLGNTNGSSPCCEASRVCKFAEIQDKTRVEASRL